MENEFEKYMSNFVNVNEVELYRIIKYQLGWADEYGNETDYKAMPIRPYPAVTLRIAQIFTDKSKFCYPFATAIEILANSWFVHGDVQNGITERNGKSSVWWVWGPAQSINTGDGLHALGRLALLDNKFDINEGIILTSLKAFDSAYLTLCEGENLDISYQEAPLLSEDDFLEMLQKRSGALFGCAFQLGYIGGNSAKKRSLNEELLKQFQELGVFYGMKRELNEEKKLLSNESLVPPELFQRFSSKKKNLFVVYLLNNSEVSVKRKIGEMYLKRVLEETDRKDIISIVNDSKFDEFFEHKKESIQKSSIELIDRMRLETDEKEQILSLILEDAIT